MNSPTAKSLTVVAMTALLGCTRRPINIITPPPITMTAPSPVPPAAARSAYIAGQLHLARSEWDAAARAFAEARDHDPASPAVMRGLAAAAAGQGDAAAEAEYLQQADALGQH